jgi:hypothetical protein
MNVEEVNWNRRGTSITYTSPTQREKEAIMAKNRSERSTKVTFEDLKYQLDRLQKSVEERIKSGNNDSSILLLQKKKIGELEEKIKAIEGKHNKIADLRIIIDDCNEKIHQLEESKLSLELLLGETNAEEKEFVNMQILETTFSIEDLRNEISQKEKMIVEIENEIGKL